LDDLQRTIGSIGFAVVIAAFAIGLVLRVVGGILRRPFWKVGLRLYSASIAGLGIVGGLAILTVPFWRFGDAWWIVFLTAPLGILTTAIGVIGVRWVVWMKVPENGERELSITSRS
jgi:hypothetical protein